MFNGKTSSVLRFNETLQSGTATVTMGLNNQNRTTNVTDVKSFRFACSFMLSEMENMALSTTGLKVIHPHMILGLFY